MLPYDDGLLVADTRWFEGSVGLAHVRGRERTGARPVLDRRRAAERRGDPGRLAHHRLPRGHPRGRDRHPRRRHGRWRRLVPGARPPLARVRGRLPRRRRGGRRLARPGAGSCRRPGRSPVCPTCTTPSPRTAAWSPASRRSSTRPPAGGCGGCPRTYLMSFSPDGRLLLGTRRGAHVLLDARTGAVRATLPKRLDRLTWEDDRHLLAVTWGRGREAMVRIWTSTAGPSWSVPCDPCPMGWSTATTSRPSPSGSDQDAGDRLAAVGRQVERGRRAPAGDHLRPERRDHGAVVGAEAGPRHPHAYADLRGPRLGHRPQP